MISAIQLPNDFKFGENALASYNRCFVVGNGPILNKFKLELLKDEIVFGVNRILLSGFKPTMLSISDKNCLYNSYADVIQKSKCDLLISKRLYEILSNDKKLTIIELYTLLNFIRIVYSLTIIISYMVKNLLRFKV